MKNIVIIEDNKYMREGWQTFIDYEEDLQVIATFNSCEDAFRSKDIDDTHLFLMDIGLPGMNGIEGVAYIREHYPEAICVMATVFDDDQHVFDALKAGAIGYLMKKVSPDELIAALRSALDGGSPITPNIARKVIQNLYSKEAKENILTDKEQEILEHLATGRSYNEIAKILFLSVDGIRYHIRNIYEKLQVHSRSEAVSKAINKKMIDPNKL